MAEKQEFIVGKFRNADLSLVTIFRGPEMMTNEEAQALVQEFRNQNEGLDEEFIIGYDHKERHM